MFLLLSFVILFSTV